MDTTPAASATLPASLEGLRRSLEVLQKRLAPQDPALAAVELALRQWNAFTEEARRADEHARLAAIYRVSHALGSSLLLDDALTQVMDAVIQLTGAERGCIMLFDESGGLDLRAARNLERETLSQKEMEYSRTVVETVARTGKAVLATNAQTDPRFSSQQSVMLYNLRAILCVPLCIKDRILGVIYADHRIHAGLFTERDLELLSSFAVQAAIAIENARLYTLTDQELSARVTELENMQRADRELNATLDPQKAATALLDWALLATRAVRGLVAVKIDPDSPPQIIAGHGYKSGDTPALPDSQTESVRAAEVTLRLSSPEQYAGLLAPVIREGKTVGWVLVERPAPDFTPAQRVVLARLADHAASAIENTRLFQAVRRANEAKTQFVSIVSHELKVPMTSIRGYADLMRQGVAGPVTEKQTEFLRTMISNVERMATLVSDLSDISRIETGRLRIDFAPVDMEASIREAVNNLSPQMDARKQRMELRLAAGLPRARTDPQRLMQVLTNLLSNACKYTPEGGSVTVCAENQAGAIRVSIQDTGIGISPEEKARLFTQFFRGESASVRDQPGWGLGLHVTKRLVELLGGEIGVESEPGKGSIFWFTQPASDETVRRPTAAGGEERGNPVS
jgi:signal transduction histidine kinase